MADIDFAILQQSSSIAGRLNGVGDSLRAIGEIASDSHNEHPMCDEEEMCAILDEVVHAVTAYTGKVYELAHKVREAQREYVMRCQEGE